MATEHVVSGMFGYVGLVAKLLRSSPKGPFLAKPSVKLFWWRALAAQGGISAKKHRYRQENEKMACYEPNPILFRLCLTDAEGVDSTNFGHGGPGTRRLPSNP